MALFVISSIQFFVKMYFLYNLFLQYILGLFLNIIIRDTRIMGQKKMDFKKMGAAHCFFFFLGAQYYFFIFHGRRTHRAPISFFFLTCPLLSKKNHGQLAHRFFCIFLLSLNLLRPSDFREKKMDKKHNLSEAPIVRPLFFFSPIIF